MTEDNSHSKSCDPQLLDEQPTQEWGVDRLGQYAQARHLEIEADERSLAQVYWRLGSALTLARGQFAHGQWSKFLNDLGIDKTRASKASAIRRSFDTEKSIDGMSVQEAYRRRKRKVRKPSPKRTRRKTTKDDQGLKMVDWLLDVCKTVDFFLDEVDSADTEEAANVLPMIDSTVEELIRLRGRLKQRICSQ